MTKLDIGGKQLEVDDSFMELPPKEQTEVVDKIASSLGMKSGEADTALASKAAGVAKAFGTGVAKGVADVAGLPGDAAGALGSIADWLAGKAGIPAVSQSVGRVLPSAIAHTLPGVGQAYDAYQLAGKLVPDDVREAVNPFRGSDVANRLMQGAIGPYRRSETVPEQFAETMGRFVPASVTPGGGEAKVATLLKDIGRYGLLPGAGSEAAGQVFKGSAAEPVARVAGGLTLGTLASLGQRLPTAETMASKALQGVTSDRFDQAEVLFNQARQQGIPISAAEAMQAVTRGATGLGDLQHTVEGMGGMKGFYAQRPAQNEAAARQVFNTIAPANPDPSQIGRAAGGAAENIVTSIRSAINNYTRPMYEAAGRHLVPEQVHAAFMQDPLFVQTARTIRNTPELNAVVQNAPDRSVRFYDEVAKQLEQRSRNAAQPLNPQANQTVAAVTGSMGSDLKDVAVASERAATGGPSSYEAALATQARLRDQYLQPVLSGMVGKIAGQDTTTKAAVDALFPANPLANSQSEIAQTMRALSRQRPGIANDLIRAHAEMTFNEAAQRLASGGESQSSGAKFAAILRGNPQQAANLEAAVRAVPNGDQIWNGFDRLLSIMEAQQYRQATGSRTAFKIPGVEDLKGGGLVNNAAQVVGGAGIPISRKVTNAIQDWNVGRNLDALADILTSPEGMRRLRQLSQLPPDSVQFATVLNRLGNIVNEGGRSGPPSSESR
jgi:hypothetical protein